MDLTHNNIGAQGARSLAAALHNNATLMILNLCVNNIGEEGARSLAAALDNNATLTTLRLGLTNNIGAQGARSLAAVLDTNRTLQHIDLYVHNDNTGIGNLVDNLVDNLVADRLRVNKHALKVSIAVCGRRPCLNAVSARAVLSRCSAMLYVNMSQPAIAQTAGRGGSVA